MPQPNMGGGWRRSLSASPLHLAFGASLIPHPAKVARGGEDAYFADHVASVFGVADGVGGSASERVDPGVFSRRLLQHCHEHLRAVPVLDRGSTQLFHDTVAAAAAPLASSAIGGSSTLLLGQLLPGGLLRLLNVGDSAAMVFRPAARKMRDQQRPVLWPRVLLRTNEATHYFNCPYQVSSSTLVEEVHANADELQVQLRAGDVVLAMTDGVIDNLFDAHLQEIVADHIRDLIAVDPAAASTAAQELATAVAKTAASVGRRQDDPSTTTPFAAAARLEGYQMDGGKMDDVAVVCAVVRQSREASASGPVMHNFET